MQDDDPGRHPPGGASAPGPRARSRPAAVVITDARGASSREMSTRIRRYTITMAFRMACFLSMLFVEGWLRWVLLACAVFLPYIAVVAANQADQRTRPTRVEPGGPQDAPQLPTAPQVEVIPGSVQQPAGERDRDEPRREGRVA